MRKPALTPLAQTELLCALREPGAVLGWPANRCSRLVQQARATGLLGRVAHCVSAAGQAAGLSLPSGVEGHFDAALRLWRAQRHEIHREARHLRAALLGLGAPVVALKGAAYVLADLPAADGRLFSDIDILVPKSSLRQAESLLLQHGWMGTPQTEYDERYYRQWMHELPPMAHVHRRTTLDVHHTLLPETARLHPDAAALFDAAEALPAWPGLKVLCPADMVLHSMTHLFLNDDTRHALRDLADLDALLRHFAGLPDFWPTLVQRAERHQLSRPLYYGLRYTRLLLGTPVPPALDAAQRGAAPGHALRMLMDLLWLKALDPTATLRASTPHGLAQFALYVRGHWLRMPFGLLLRHLGVKALRLHERPAVATNAQAPV